MTSDPCGPTAAGYSADRSVPPAPSGLPTVDRSGPILPSRLSPVYMVISAGEQLRSLGPAVLAVGIWQRTWWVYGIGGVLLLVLAVIRWWTRIYSVTGGQFQVRSGLFRRSVDSIPVRRVTAIDAHRGVVQRALGVWGLRVHSPGNYDSVHLSCLSTAALERLRAAVDPSVANTGLAEPADRINASVVLQVLDFRTLLTAAVTGTSIPLIFVGGAVAWNRIRDFVPGPDFDWVRREIFGHGRSTVALLALFVLVAAVVAVFLTSLRMANFTLIRDGDRLRVSRGLIAQRTWTVPHDRVQAIRIVEGVVRRRLGYCQLEVEVAGLGRGNTADRMLFPLLRTERVPELIGRALPELGWSAQPPTPVPGRAARRYLTLPIMLALPLTLGLWLLPTWGAFFALLPIPVALLIGIGQARSAAWCVDPATMTMRWQRVLARHTLVARTARVQLTSVSVTPFQRRAAMAGFTVELSSRRKGHLRQLPAEDARRLQHVVGRRAVLFAGR